MLDLFLIDLLYNMYGVYTITHTNTAIYFIHYTYIY